ncbi:MAG: AsmA family protein [Wenzhouxiangellaceae bacterium]
MRKFLIILASLLLILIGLWGSLLLYFDNERLKRIAIEQVRAATGRELAIDGELDLRFFPRLSLVANDVRLSGPEGFDGPGLFEAERLKLSVEPWPLLRGEVRTGDIGLDGAVLNIHTDRRGVSSLDGLMAAESPSEAETGIRLQSEGIELSDTRIVLSDARSPARQVFVIERLRMDRFALDTPVPLHFSGTIGEPPTVDQIELDATLVIPSDGSALQIDDLDLGAVAAGLPLGLTGRAELRAGPPMAFVLENGVLDLNGYSFNASLRYTDADRPQVQATLDGTALDVDALLAAMPGGEQAADSGSADASPLLILRDFDVTAEVALDSMVLSGLQLSKVRAGMRSRSGQVTIDPLSAQLNGGRVAAVARVDLNAEPPVLRLEPVFELERLGDALAAWGLDRWISGGGRLDLSLDARGLTPSAILGSLNGRGHYALRDGALEGVDLNALAEAITARSVQTALVSVAGGRTEFKSFSGAIEVRDGRLELPGLKLVAGDWMIDGDVALTLADTGLDGRLIMQLPSVGRVPVQLGGTLGAPKLAPDLGGLIRQEAGRRLLDLLDRRRDGGEDDGPDGGDGSG